jgi:hypothetical protein
MNPMEDPIFISHAATALVNLAEAVDITEDPDAQLILLAGMGHIARAMGPPMVTVQPDGSVIQFRRDT